MSETIEYVDHAALARIDAFARQHDWYVGRTVARVIVLDRYSIKHANGAITHHEDWRSFNSMRMLRDWAGY